MTKFFGKKFIKESKKFNLVWKSKHRFVRMTNACGIKLYTVKEAMEMLGICKNKIYELMKTHVLEYVDLNGVRKITEQQIKDAIVKLSVTGNHKLYPKE